MHGGNNQTLMALEGWEASVMLSRYTHLSPIHRWKAVEDLTQVGTVTVKGASSKKTQKLLEGVVSRLGLEPRTLALKARTEGFT